MAVGRPDSADANAGLTTLVGAELDHDDPVLQQLCDMLHTTGLYDVISGYLGAPGLDIVPRRVELLPTGTEGAMFSWSIDPALVDELGEDAATERPVFAPGDVAHEAPSHMGVGADVAV